MVWLALSLFMHVAILRLYCLAKRQMNYITLLIMITVNRSKCLPAFVFERFSSDCLFVLFNDILCSLSFFETYKNKKICLKTFYIFVNFFRTFDRNCSGSGCFIFGKEVCCLFIFLYFPFFFIGVILLCKISNSSYYQLTKQYLSF